MYLTWASYVGADSDLLGVHIPLSEASIYQSIADGTLDPVLESSDASSGYSWIPTLALEGRIWVDVLVRQWRRNIGVLAFDWTGAEASLDRSDIAYLRLLGQILGFQLSAADPALARTLSDSLAGIYGDSDKEGDISAAMQALRKHCDIASLSLFRYRWPTDTLVRASILALQPSTHEFGLEEYPAGSSLTGLAFRRAEYRRILHFDTFMRKAPHLVNGQSLAFHEASGGPVRSAAYATIGVEEPVYLLRAINHRHRPRLGFVEDHELIANFAQWLSPYVDAELADNRTTALSRLQRLTLSGASLADVASRAQELLFDIEGIARCSIVIQREGTSSEKPHFLWGPADRIALEVRDTLDRHAYWKEIRSGSPPTINVLRRQQSGPFGRMLGVTAREDSDVAILRMRAGSSFGCLVFPVYGDGWGRFRKNELIPASSLAFVEQVAALVIQAAEQAYVAAQAEGALQALSLVGHEMSEPLATTTSLMAHGLTLASEVAAEASRPDLLRQIANLRAQITGQTAVVDAAMRLGLLVGRQVDGAIQGYRRSTHVGTLLNAALGQVRSEVSQGHLPTPSALKVPKPRGQRDAMLALDAPLVRAALVNLFRNAVKYSVSVDGETRLEVTVVELKARGLVDIEVTNFGPEIPMMERETIFDAFTRGEIRPPYASVRGMGLGLYLVRQIALAHEGNAFVKGQDALAGGIYRTTITLRLRSDLEIGEYPKGEKA